MHAAHMAAPPVPAPVPLPPAPPAPLALELEAPEEALAALLDDAVPPDEEHDAESAAKTKIHVHFIAPRPLPGSRSSGSERQ
jgi:hypothetical protein